MGLLMWSLLAGTHQNRLFPNAPPTYSLPATCWCPAGTELEEEEATFCFPLPGMLSSLGPPHPRRPRLNHLNPDS